MKRLCLVALAACTTSIGSQSDPTAEDAGADPDAAPTYALPREPRGLQVAPNGMYVNAAIDVDGTLMVVGTRKEMSPSLNDVAIVRDTAQVATAQFAGGVENDQLFALARNGTNVLAVGITRSYLAGLTGDQVLLTLMQPTTQTISFGRLYVATDEALQPRTVAPLGAGWLIGGTHLVGARGFITITAATGAPVQAVSFLLGPAATGLVVRRVLGDADRIYAVGYAVQGAKPTGFVAAFDANTLTPVWGARVDSAIDVQVMDAALGGNTLRVVGWSGRDGFVIDFAADSGTVTANQTYVNTPFVSLLRHGFGWWIAGRTGASPIAGTLLGDKLHAVMLSDLTLSGLSAQSLVERADGISVVGSRTTGLVEVPLNGTPVGACDGLALGAPLTVPASTGTIAVTPTAVGSRALALTFAAPTATVTTPAVAPFDACH